MLIQLSIIGINTLFVEKCHRVSLTLLLDSRAGAMLKLAGLGILIPPALPPHGWVLTTRGGALGALDAGVTNCGGGECGA